MTVSVCAAAARDNASDFDGVTVQRYSSKALQGRQRIGDERVEPRY